VAVLFADGAVVVVLVDGDVVELAGLVVVVVVDGEVVDGEVVDAPAAAVVEEEEPLDVPPGEDPAPAVFAEDPFEAVVLEAMPTVSGADFVWNASTPASPASVATATIGARFICLVSCSQVSCDRPVSERERLEMDLVIRRAQPTRGRHDGVGETAGSTDVNVSFSEVWDEVPKRSGIETHLGVRTDHLVNSAAASFDECGDLVAVHEVTGRLRPHDDDDVD